MLTMMKQLLLLPFLLMFLLNGCARDEGTVESSPSTSPLPIGPAGKTIKTPQFKAIDNMAVTPDGQTLITIGTAGRFVSWNIDTTNMVVENSSYTVPWKGGWDATATENGTRAVIFSNTSFAFIKSQPFRTISSGKVAWKFDQTAFIRTAGISPDGNSLFVLTKYGMRIYELPGFSIRQEADSPGGLQFFQRADVGWLDQKIFITNYDLKFTKSGKKRQVSQVYVWDIKYNKVITVPKLGNENELISHFDNSLISYSSDGCSATIWMRRARQSR